MFKKVFSSLVVAVALAAMCALGLAACGGSSAGGDVLKGEWDIVAWDGYGTEPSEIVYNSETKRVIYGFKDAASQNAEVDVFSDGKKTDYRKKTSYKLIFKGNNKVCMDMTSLSDNVMLVDGINVLKTTVDTENVSGKTVIRRAVDKNSDICDKSELTGKFTLPESFGAASLSEMTFNSGDKVSFAISGATKEAALVETDHGYGFTMDLGEDCAAGGRYIRLEIVETGESYITLYYIRALSEASAKSYGVEGVTLVKAA